jgi:23S rRNA pseudouridine1911/1915/1917 synthase
MCAARISPTWMSSTEAQPAPQVLYADDVLAVVCKPAGMPVLQDRTGHMDLLRTVARMWPSRSERLRVLHRLDRPVSGCVLLSWDATAVATLSKSFAEGEVGKTYLAIAEGAIHAPTVLEHRALHDARRHVACRVPMDAPQGRTLRLRIRPLAHGERYTLLEVLPEGGAFHQIRAQLGWAGHPIMGDVKYGARRASKDRSIALHALSLSFTHPDSGSLVRVEAPPPTAPPWPSLLALVDRPGA